MSSPDIYRGGGLMPSGTTDPRTADEHNVPRSPEQKVALDLRTADMWKLVRRYYPADKMEKVFETPDAPSRVNWLTRFINDPKYDNLWYIATTVATVAALVVGTRDHAIPNPAGEGEVKLPSAATTDIGAGTTFRSILEIPNNPTNPTILVGNYGQVIDFGMAFNDPGQRPALLDNLRKYSKEQLSDEPNIKAQYDAAVEQLAQCPIDIDLDNCLYGGYIKGLDLPQEFRNKFEVDGGANIPLEAPGVTAKQPSVRALRQVADQRERGRNESLRAQSLNRGNRPRRIV